jgi:hypothetical protein
MLMRFPKARLIDDADKGNDSTVSAAIRSVHD